MSKPVVIDLCCGRFGWAKGFLSEGFRVIGFDLQKMCEVPEGADLVLQDVLTVTSKQIERAAGVVASTPCQEFSVWGMRHFHPNPPLPEIGIKLFNHVRDLCESAGVPYIMENVRAAQQFVGPSVNHLGPFHLWGNAVPAIMPAELYKLSKGFGTWKDHKAGGMQYSSKSKARAEFSARVAEIPFELASHIARVFKP